MTGEGEGPSKVNSLEEDSEPNVKANTPATGKKHLTKSDHTVSDDNGASPSKSSPSKAGPFKANSLQDESSEQEVIIQPLSMKDLRSVRKDYSHCESKTLRAWLIRCWDTGTDTRLG